MHKGKLIRELSKQIVPQMPPPPTKWRPAYVVAYDNYIAALAALRTPEEPND